MIITNIENGSNTNATSYLVIDNFSENIKDFGYSNDTTTTVR
jgi:hypothetical protein